MSKIKCLHIFIIILLAIGNIKANYSNDNTNLTVVDSILTISTNDSLLSSVSDVDNKLEILNKELALSFNTKDTLSAIRCLISITDVERFSGNYNNAFDKLWDALLLANAKNDQLSIVHIHRNLGILYSIFNKDSLAQEHLQKSIRLASKLKQTKKIKNTQLRQSYFSLASINREKAQYEIALKYLDSVSINNHLKFLPFVEAEKGLIYLKQELLDQAEKSLTKANRYFISTDDNYQVASNMYMGDLKLAQNKIDSAVLYYKSSLNALNTKEAFLEFKPEILKKLALLNLKKNSYLQAYHYLSSAYSSSDSLFNAKSKHNNQLFEIKNKYKEALLEQEKLVQKQNLIIQQKSKVQFILTILIVLIILLAIAGIIVFRLKNSLKKLNLQQQLESDKNKEVLEVKSKELTTYALQLIDKEQALQELLATIKKEAPNKHTILQNKYGKGSNNLWEEFNMRFVEVNSDFYEKLRNAHPNITATELKHCALIKLNFDSNEMSKILNISLQSVHTSRYRIRKKIQLAHEESLSNYISEF